jgi:hypothetical protein
MMGQWALYDDGWFLSTKVDRAPWDAFGAANPDPLNNQVFELYNLNGLQPKRERRGEESQGAQGQVHRRGEEVPGLSAGRVGGCASDRAAPEHHRRSF